MAKVIVLGLDGGTWDLIKPLADEGILPTFKRLMQDGVWGVLESTFPPGTCPGWPSMLTGKRPEKLGLYYFTKRDAAGYEPRINRIALERPVWQILNSHGKQSYMINVPLTEVPGEDETTGVFVAGPIMHKTDNVTNQPRVQSMIEDIGYEVLTPVFREGQEQAHLEEVISHSQRQFALVRELLSEQWDLFFYVNYLTDTVSHRYWRYLDETHPNHEANEQIVSLIRAFYVEIDRLLDDLSKNAPNLFVVSDHGFGPLYCEINLNSWLTRDGFLRRIVPPSPRPGSRMLGSVTRRIGGNPLARSLRKRVVRHIIRRERERKPQKSIVERAPLLDQVDWPRTKAYSLYYGGVNVNLKGREPLGCVEQADYERVREEIIEQALQIRDEEGRQVVGEALKVEDMYESPPMISFPDVVLKFKDMRYRNRVNINLGLDLALFTKDRDSGGHTEEGLFLAHGNGIRRGSKIETARIYDIVPTILHTIGVPVPGDIDGRVLKEIFEEGSPMASRETAYEEAIDPRQRTSMRIQHLKARGKL